jgi:hypothetical protein
MPCTVGPEPARQKFFDSIAPATNMRRTFTSESSGKLGKLAADHTFVRVFGTPKRSEPILAGLVSAWAPVMVGMPAATEAVEIKLLDRMIYNANLPKGKNNLIADIHLHASNLDAKFLVEIQHRPERNFADSAILYSSADVVTQRFAEGVTQASYNLKPVHNISFCDFSFGGDDTRVALADTKWRASKDFKSDVNRAFAAYSLTDRGEDLRKVVGHNYIGNKGLDAFMNNRLSFFFMLLPHMPPLEQLTAATPSIVKWGSLVAHLTPYNAGAIPIEIKQEKAVQMVLDELMFDVSLAEEEALAARDAEIRQADLNEEALLMERRNGMELFLRKFSSAEDYESKMGEKLDIEFHDLIGSKDSTV